MANSTDLSNDPKYRAMAQIQSIDIEIQLLELERALMEQLLRTEDQPGIPPSPELIEYCKRQYEEMKELIEFSIEHGTFKAKAQKIKEIALLTPETELKT